MNQLGLKIVVPLRLQSKASRLGNYLLVVRVDRALAVLASAFFCIKKFTQIIFLSVI